MTETQKNALIQLGNYLTEKKYQFTTITPESHRRVNERLNASHDSDDNTLRDLFGWSRLVAESRLPKQVLNLLNRAELLVERNSFVKSLVRFSTLEQTLFAHSAFPTIENDAVFFGPDTYRFVKYLKNVLEKNKFANKIKNVADIGCGSGAGGLALQKIMQNSGEPIEKIYLSDINQRALDFSDVNAKLAQIHNVEIFKSDLLKNLPEGIDTLIANPPFIMDSDARAYRHGGNSYGADVTLKIIEQGLDYLKPGGQMFIYTGACIVRGQDMLKLAIAQKVGASAEKYEYEEIDPDIFGEELSHPNYHDVERLAAVGIYLMR